jgi:hypothetical protein
VTTSYVIYYTEDGTPKSETATELGAALKASEAIRKLKREGANISHITMSSEDTDMVGQQGVDSIVDGKTPDGVEYTWRKRRP